MSRGSTSRIAAIVGVALILLGAWSFAIWEGTRDRELGPSFVQAMSVPPLLRSGTPDTALYMLVIRRMHAGESYYSASSAVLRQINQYDPGRVDLSSPLSFRMPPVYWLLGSLPATGLSYVIAALVAGSLASVAAFVLARRFAILPLALLSCALVAWYGAHVATTSNMLATEIWAAAFGLLSLALFVQVRGVRAGHIPRLMWGAAAAALAAMLVREIAVSFALVGLAATLSDSRARAARLWQPWLVALAVGGLAYVAHVVAVMPWLVQMPGAALFSWFYPDGSGAIGGVMRTASFLSAPGVIAAVLVILGIIGSLVAPSSRPQRVLLATTTIGAVVITALAHPPGIGLNGQPPAYWYDLAAPATLACAPLALTLLARMRSDRPKAVAETAEDVDAV